MPLRSLEIPPNPVPGTDAVAPMLCPAVGQEIPDFQWTYVGAFMAHQVRAEILNVYETVAVGKALGSVIEPVATQLGMPLINSARDSMINTLIQGQRDVVTDLVSMTLAYQTHGGDAMSQAMGTRTTAGRAFALQTQSDQARSIGDIGQAELLGSQAAYNLGIHEQVRLQTMWENPLLNAMGKANATMLDSGWPLASFARPLDIYVGANKYTDSRGEGLGYIKAPASLPNKDVTQLETRLGIAKNAFNYMYKARQDPVKYNTIQNSFSKMYDSSRLYNLPAILRPLPKWNL